VGSGVAGIDRESIAIDTTVLIDEFRAKGNLEAPVNRALLAHGNEELIIPVIAAGEFLDGAAMISERRFQDALRLLQTRKIVSGYFRAAEKYGRAVADLRKQNSLSGRSQNDLWIAAISLATGARLLTRNPDAFTKITGLEVLGYV